MTVRQALIRFSEVVLSVALLYVAAYALTLYNIMPMNTTPQLAASSITAQLYQHLATQCQLQLDYNWVVEVFMILCPHPHNIVH